MIPSFFLYFLVLYFYLYILILICISLYLQLMDTFNKKFSFIFLISYTRWNRFFQCGTQTFLNFFFKDFWKGVCSWNIRRLRHQFFHYLFWILWVYVNALHLFMHFKRNVNHFDISTALRIMNCWWFPFLYFQKVTFLKNCERESLNGS